ncbi:MAG: TatD family hydrolase [Elusimicrobia bacterium]|nr:TatD family hydrolase [Elusimicrobiota bacterium]
MELIDTHAHLTDPGFDADRSAVIERARAAGVGRIIEIADSPADWPKAVALCRARPAIRCSLGLHPYYAAQYSEGLLAELGSKARLPEVVAVGETGLDYAKTDLAPAVQRRAFEAVLAAARSWDMPVVIHCRSAYPDLLAILAERFPAPPAARRFWGVVHCFSGTPDQAVACARLGFAIGADGPVTYPKNDPLREAFRRVGPDATVLETDSPYLPPQSIRGKRNEPASVPELARRLAEVWGLDVSEAARRTTGNALSLFGLPDAA